MKQLLAREPPPKPGKIADLGKPDESDEEHEVAQHGEASGIELPQNVDLVQLIEQPEWKAILYELVNTERMDPWDIDLCELADKYLSKISSLKGTDLRLPANAILASAILLRFKSRILKLTDIDDELEKAELAQQEAKGFAQLEQELPELFVIRKAREGKVSLDELVESIGKMLEKSKRKSSLMFNREEQDELKFRLPAIGANIEQLLEEAYALVNKNLDSQGIALFSQMVTGRDAAGVINVFIPLLLLMNRSRVVVWQDEFFGEVFVALAKESEEKKGKKEAQ